MCIRDRYYVLWRSILNVFFMSSQCRFPFFASTSHFVELNDWCSHEVTCIEKVFPLLTWESRSFGIQKCDVLAINGQQNRAYREKILLEWTIKVLNTKILLFFFLCCIMLYLPRFPETRSSECTLRLDSDIFFLYHSHVIFNNCAYSVSRYGRFVLKS